MMRKPETRPSKKTRNPIGRGLQKESSQEWVAKMHTFHEETGLYRAEDLNRVLGDPRTQIVGTEIPDWLVSCQAEK
jgi:hypothetical protein